MTHANKTSALEIMLPEILDIASSRPLHSELNTALSENGTISVYGTDVERVDAAAMQVLIAASMATNNRPKKLEWKSPSEALIRTATLLGVEKLAGLENSKNILN
jgi:anti-anti-sigma regulatory factor